MAIVVLAEKPSVGREIARVLGATKKHQGYLEGCGYIVTWAFGHLAELMEPEDYDPSLKRWSTAALPIIPEKFSLKISSGKGVREQFNIIKTLFKSADAIISATDAGREGELIFRYILELCRCTRKPVQRLWISSMTDSAIRQGFSSLKPLSHYDNLASAARCRSEADWIVGLNATRGYTLQHSHGRGLFSVGRVQTPVLALIVRRDAEIRNFKPEDYWELWSKYREVEFKHATDKFKTKEEAELLLSKVRGAAFAIVSIEEKNHVEPPPLLFDLTELQRVMNRSRGMSASRTLQLAQSLYEKKMITYPRTDSRYLTDDLYPQCRTILQKLSADHSNRIAPLNLGCLNKSKRCFNTQKVADHHAIIPTGEVVRGLDAEENSVYQAIVTRFIAIFYPPCEKAHTTVCAEAGGELFKAKGTRILKAGWLSLYLSDGQLQKEGEQLLPSFTIGERGAHDPYVKTCRTKPPHHYTEATLLSAMETAGKAVDDEELKEAMKERGLGTPATRAAIIEILLKREYLTKQGKTLLATAKGEELIRLLAGQPTLTSAEMTAEWEYRLKEIERGRYKAADFMQNISTFTKEIVDSLAKGNENSPHPLGCCPLCSAPVIRGRSGFGCSAWKTGCPFRFHEEQYGTKIIEKDVAPLLARGSLTHPRLLVDGEGNRVRGYLTIDSTGKIGMITREAKIAENAIGPCPQCGSSVLDNYKSYSCTDCDFVIWKTIAGKKISPKLAKLLLDKRKSSVLNGFRSKAGKSFSASLKIEEGKIAFAFSNDATQRP